MKIAGLENWYQRNSNRINALIAEALTIQNSHLRTTSRPLLNKDGVLLQYRGDDYAWKFQLVTLEDSACRVLVGSPPHVQLVESKQGQTIAEPPKRRRA